MSEEIKRLKQFGIILSCIFLFFSSIMYFKVNNLILSSIFLFISITSIISVFLFPSFLIYPEKFLIAVGEILGYINTRIILTLLFIIAITPLAIIMKIFGKKTLDISIDKNTNSYWQKYQPPTIKECHKRQF